MFDIDYASRERKSLDANPSAEVLMPDLLATIIRKQRNYTFFSPLAFC